MAAPDYLRYANSGATRSLPLNPRLVSALAFLPDLGVQAEVFSGGQPGKGSGGKRVGSVRHDHGNAADVRFYREGRMLDWADPGDRPVFQEIVKRSKENGLTGFGAGPGYMAPGTMHIGYGTPGVWGAGGRGANAPDWLRKAYGLAPLGENVASSTNNSDFGQEPSMASMRNNVGGLGGLGGMPEEPQGVMGFLGSAGFGDWLQAAGASLMSSPSNNAFQDFGQNLSSRQAMRQRQDALEIERADKENDRAALQSLLMSRGFSPEEAQSYSANANVANAAIAGLATDEAKAEKNQTKQWLRDNHPDLAGLPVDEALKIAYQRRANGPKTSLTPVYGTDEQGNAVLLQPRDDGTLVKTQMPEGVTISTGTEQIDAGTHWVVKDKRSGEVVGTIPKDNRGEARDTAAGTVEGKTEAERAASASTDAANAQNALDLIDKIRNHPYIDRGTGFGSYGNVIRGTGGFDFENMVEQAKSGAFLQAIPQLKGLGALSNTEGQAATAAITRMNTSTSKEAFLEALDDYEKIVRQGLMKAQSNAAKGVAVPAPSAEPAPQPSSYRDKYGLD